MPSSRRALPTVLSTGLRIVFCGTAVGTASARQGAYYAGPGNKFWTILAETGLTARRFLPSEFRELSLHGIGLTDLAPLKTGMDRVLKPSDFNCAQLRRAILRTRPRVLAFNGKLAASIFLGKPTGRIGYGMQRDADFPMTAIFVLPSTSGAACRSWDASVWFALAQSLAA